MQSPSDIPHKIMNQSRFISPTKTLQYQSPLQLKKLRPKSHNIIIPKIKPSIPIFKQTQQNVSIPEPEFVNPFSMPDPQSFADHPNKDNFKIYAQNTNISPFSSKLTVSQPLTHKNQQINSIEHIQRRILSDTESDDLNTSASNQSGFVPFQEPKRNALEISQNQQSQNEQETKSAAKDSGKNENEQMTKKRKRRSVDQVKETYRCFCGKNFVSYPGIYLHLKEKHLQQQDNQKFYLKTFKHKVTGEIVKQVVLQNPKDSTQNVQHKKTLLQKKSQPIVLQIDDDDETPSLTEPKTTQKINRRKSKLKQGKQIVKKCEKGSREKENQGNGKEKWEDKYMKLSREYKELQEKFINSQKEYNQALRDLKEQLSKKDDIIKGLQKQLQNENVNQNAQTSNFHQPVITLADRKKNNQKPQQNNIEIIILQDDDEQQSSSPQKSVNQTETNSKQSESDFPLDNNEFSDRFDQSQSSGKMTPKFGCSWESIQLQNSLTCSDFEPLNEETEREIFEVPSQQRETEPKLPHVDYSSELQEGEIQLAQEGLVSEVMPIRN